MAVGYIISTYYQTCFRLKFELLIRFAMLHIFGIIFALKNSPGRNLPVLSSTHTRVY